MFCLCHFKDNENHFILYDKNDLKEIAEQMHIEIEGEVSFEELKRNYASYPMVYVNDLILRSLNRRARTVTHVLDELNISCWAALKKEFDRIQEKKSKLSRSQRELVVNQYNFITNLDDVPVTS